MKTARLIDEIFNGYTTIDGAGVKLKRHFGHKEVSRFDPFLQFDHFQSGSPQDYIKGFPWHPHRGIETITYVLEGSLNHADSVGNSGVISDGAIQWVTAGSGVIHQEIPRGNKRNYLNGIQLWMNLPAREKMCPPEIRNISRIDIPTVHVTSTSTVKVVAGTLDSVRGPVADLPLQPSLFDISLSSETEFVVPTPFDHTFFAFIMEGEASFGQQNPPEDSSGEILCHVHSDSAVLFSKGDFITVITENEPVRLLVAGAAPLKEPVAWYGPIVMSNDEELQHAFEEFQLGTFMKHHSVSCQ
jgi:quercetin 2,3-dioxygenase